MADECRGYVGVEGICRRKFLALSCFLGQDLLHFHNCRGVACGNDAVSPGVFPPDDLLLPDVLYEVERNPVCLVEEQCVLLDQGIGILQPDIDFP